MLIRLLKMNYNIKTQVSTYKLRSLHILEVFTFFSIEENHHPPVQLLIYLILNYSM
jgi:hypothetical protein